MWQPETGQGETGEGGMGRILRCPYAVRHPLGDIEPASVDGGSSRRSEYLAVPTRVYQVDTSSLRPSPASPCLACCYRSPPSSLRCTVARYARCRVLTTLGVQQYTARQFSRFPRSGNCQTAGVLTSPSISGAQRAVPAGGFETGLNAPQQEDGHF